MTTAIVSTASLGAYAAGDAALRENQYFNTDSTLDVSQVFPVNHQPHWIEAYNLSDFDELTIEQVTGEGSGTLFGDFCPFNGPIKLSPSRTKVRLDWSGRYRLKYTGTGGGENPGGIGTFTVVGYFGSLTHESTLELTEALRSVVTGTTIEGTDPIVVSGLGTSATPYVISANQADIAQIELGVPAQYLINAGTLKHIVNSRSIELDCRLGINAGINNTGTGNVFVGNNSSSVTISDNSIFVGVACGSGLLTSPVTDVICIGVGTANNSGLGSGSIGIGNVAGFGAFNLANAVFIGHHALQNAASADDSVVIGYQAAQNSNGLGSAVVIGKDAAININGASGVIIGVGAANSGSTQMTGVFVGTSVAQNSNFLLNSVCIGTDAGTNIDYSAYHPTMGPETFTDSIFIGHKAGLNETFKNVIIIGINPLGTQLNATQDDQIILGNSTQTQLVTAGSVISGGVIAPSDERLKKNIKDFKTGLDLVRQLRPVTHEWNEHTMRQANVPCLQTDLGKTHYAVIAQEIEKVLPEVIEHVNTGFGNYKYVRYDRTIPILYSAINQLAEENDELKKNLLSLSKEVEKMKKSMNSSKSQ